MVRKHLILSEKGKSRANLANMQSATAGAGERYQQGGFNIPFE
jgi:hypothetical protein